MLNLKSVSEEVRELTDDEELAEHIEQLVWARLYYFDQKLAEFDQRLADAKAQNTLWGFILPFTVGFCSASLGSLVLYFWGC